MANKSKTWRHAKDCWQETHATSEEDTHCDCRLSEFVNMIYNLDKNPVIEDVPVCLIGAWGSPVVVGTADFQGSKDVHIHFKDNDLIGEFYDLKDQEIIVSISFRYHEGHGV